ncbi:MAG: (Fe-S)-binding protein [Candidatus Heimdallarchaeota archaeon]|nr:MAG: (Fe-S)-binding protein [Candidatus Heimdallarchaeota archaeon]
MYELKFDEKTCETCPTSDCLVKCQYIDIDKDTAKTEIKKMISGEDSFVLHECVTCYACEEYCQRGNHPFYLITDLQEKKGVLPMPKPLKTQFINIPVPTRRDIIQFYGAEEPVISLCIFPQYIKLFSEEKFFQDLSIIIGRYFFCQLMYLHSGNPSLIRERLPGIIENITQHGFKEVIFFHDECYSTLTSYADAYDIEVPFKPIHFYDYLYTKLEREKKKIHPLEVKVAFQRNCSARLTPDIEHFVDDIFNIIGVERVERKYDRENSLCCGGVIRGHQRYDRFVDIQTRNVEDMVNAGVDYCVFQCPACFDFLSEKVLKNRIKPIMMHDLCLLALQGSDK